MTTFYTPAYQNKAGYRQRGGSFRANGTEVVLGDNQFRPLRLGKEIFLTPQEAQIVAREQKAARIASLKKTLAKLEPLSY